MASKGYRVLGYVKPYQACTMCERRLVVLFESYYTGERRAVNLSICRSSRCAEALLRQTLRRIARG